MPPFTKIKTVFLFVATWITCVLIVSGEVCAQENIAEVVKLAKTFDPTYQASIAALESAEKELSNVESLLGPKVTLSISSFKTERTEESTLVSGIVQQQDRNFNSRLTQIQARQPVYRLRDYLTIEQAHIKRQAANEALLSAEQDLLFRLFAAWLDVLASQEILRISSQLEATAQQYVAELSKKRTVGEATIQELEQALAKQMLAEAMLLDSKVSLDIASQALRNIVGREMAITDRFAIAYLRQYPRVMLSDDQLTDLIAKKNPDIRRARYQEDIARYERDKARADYFPSVEAYISASRGDNDANTSIKDEQRIGIQLSVPLYTHGAISSAVAQADANFRRIKAETDAVVLRLRLEAFSAQSLAYSLAARIAAADRITQANQLSLRATERGVAAGISSRAEIAQAMQEFFGAMKNQITLRKEYLVASLRLSKILSELDESKINSYQEKLRDIAKP